MNACRLHSRPPPLDSPHRPPAAAASVRVSKDGLSLPAAQPPGDDNRTLVVEEDPKSYSRAQTEQQILITSRNLLGRRASVVPQHASLLFFLFLFLFVFLFLPFHLFIPYREQDYTSSPLLDPSSLANNNHNAGNGAVAGGGEGGSSATHGQATGLGLGFGLGLDLAPPAVGTVTGGGGGGGGSSTSGGAGSSSSGGGGTAAAGAAYAELETMHVSPAVVAAVAAPTATATDHTGTAISGASPVLNTTAAPLESVIAPLLVDGPWTVLREIEREALDALRARDQREATLKQADMDDGSRLLAVINARLDESAFPHPPLKREGVVFSTIKACEETRAFLLHLVDKPFIEPPSTPATPILTGDPLNNRDAPANKLSESSDGLARFYARFVTFESLKHALDFMRRYASDHYTNLAWASTIISGLLSLKAKELGHASDVALSYTGARQEDLDRLALPERSPTDTQQQIQHVVRRHFDDMLTFWQSEVDPSEAGKTIDVGTEGGRRAFAAIKQAATSFSQRGVLAPEEDASTDVFVVGKDVTRSSLVGREAFFGPRASRGGHAGYVIARGVLQEPVDEVLGWIALIAYVDLWSIQLRHKLVRIAIVFVARLLALVKPAILVTHASKLSSIVRRGMIGAAIGTVDTPEQRAFLGVQTRTTRTLLEH
ncbi:hypothetical protein B0A53_06497, partial [Rhodotorula sp. CCFEE 5036]